MQLPADYQALLDMPPEQIQQICDELAERPLDDASGMDTWLRDWTNLAVLFQECMARLQTATSVNTADEAAQERLARYRQKALPLISRIEQVVDERMQAHADWLPPVVREVRSRQAAVQRLNRSPKSLDLLNQESALIGRYEAIRGAQLIPWEGENVSHRQLLPTLRGPDRALRERVWRAGAERQQQDRDAIHRIWSELIDVRVQLAEENGFEDYLAYRWAFLERHDYTPADSARLHEALFKHWSPLQAARLNEKKAIAQVETLRPWDMDIATQTLRPFTTADDLLQKTINVYQRLDPEFGAYVRQMRDAGMIDLAERTNTGSMGGFSQAIGRLGSFIFLNVTGTRSDITGLIHELGHGLNIRASSAQPYITLIGMSADFGEAPSCAMEMLTQPYWDEYYNADDLPGVLRRYFRGVVHGGLEVSGFDAFQHRVYRNPEAAHHPDTCDEWWHEIMSRNVPGVDWRGVEALNGLCWQYMGLNFYAPLHGLEYFYGHMAGLHLLTLPPAEAVSRYKSALAMGITVTPKALFGALGVDFPITEEAIIAAAGQLAERI